MTYLTANLMFSELQKLKIFHLILKYFSNKHCVQKNIVSIFYNIHYSHWK